MEMSFSGKSVILTGGSRGIGREICRAFLEEAPNVSFCARNAEQVEAAVKERSPLGTIHGSSVSLGTVYFEAGSWHNIEQRMPAILSQTLARNPTGRMASPAEVANAVVFLSSPRSSFTTGTNRVIDGALTQRVDF